MTIRSILISAGNLQNDSPTGGGGGGIVLDSEPWALAVTDSVQQSVYTSCTGLDTAGNVYVSGQVYQLKTDLSNTTQSTYICKFTNIGALQWVKVFPDYMSEDTNYYFYIEPYCIASNIAGTKIYLTGYVEDTNNWYVYLGCINPTTGDVLWQRGIGEQYSQNNMTYYNGGYGHDIVCDPAGNIYVSGNISFNNADCGLLVKFSSTGDIIWKKGFSSASAWGYGVEIDKNNNIVIAMESNLIDYNNATWTCVAKFTAAGQLLWIVDMKVAASSWRQGQNRVAIDSNANVYVTGQNTITITGSTKTGVDIIKLDGTTGYPVKATILAPASGAGTNSNASSPVIKYNSKTDLFYVAYDTTYEAGTYILVWLDSNLLPQGNCRVENVGAWDWGINSLEIDSSGNVFIMTDGYFGGSGWRSAQLVKNANLSVPAPYVLGGSTFIISENACATDTNQTVAYTTSTTVSDITVDSVIINPIMINTRNEFVVTKIGLVKK